ncbi:hypothetical protein [Novosphingobium aquae]|uniref:Uncharacterized protein n=1 Tax=Novosphingobium aquae TaxID=3133435 RepID=A0ABU8S686_9SPHN
MDKKTRDLVVRLCTQIGAAMEDLSPDLLFTRGMSDVEIIALLDRLDGVLAELQKVASQLRRITS